MNILEDLQEMMNNVLKTQFFYGVPIIQSNALVTRTQARKHKKKRINKKWLNRYGYKTSPDLNAYVINDTIYGGRQKIIAYPKVAMMIGEAINANNKIF